MKQYEITIIVDPVLSGDDLKSAVKTYTDMIVANGGAIVNVDEMGLRPLAYPINKRASGTFFCIEFTLEANGLLPKMELAMRRDDRVMRYLTIVLDKYGIKFNEDRRAGKIGSSKKEKGAKGKKGAPAEPVAEAPVAPATPAAVEAPAAKTVAVEAPVAPVVEATVEAAAPVVEAVAEAPVAPVVEDTAAELDPEVAKLESLA